MCSSDLIAYPDTSDGQKGTLLSMNVSDISNALKAGGIGKRSTAPENPADWTMRANLIPRSIVGLNRDRAIKYLLTYVLIGVLIVSLVVSVFMFAQSTWADHRVEVAQQKTISLQKEKAQFKDVEDTLNSLDDAQKAKIAMDLGFTSIMYDCSTLGFEENCRAVADRKSTRLNSSHIL